MNKNVVIAVALLLIVGVGAIFVLNSDSLNRGNEVKESENEMAGAPQKDESLKAVDEETAMEMKELLYKYSGNLTDVTKGVEVRGINTGGKSTGIAKSNYDGSQYLLLATFEDLPDPAGDDFYEGWIVQKNPFKFISTGKVEKVEGLLGKGGPAGDHTGRCGSTGRHEMASIEDEFHHGYSRK
jgi:hypothetical protein